MNVLFVCKQNAGRSQIAQALYERRGGTARSAHEAEHHRNPQAAEAVVECYAIQDIRRVAILFNGTKTFANEAALLARDVAYPRQYASYRTRACRAGGPLDRTPGDGRWP